MLPTHCMIFLYCEKCDCVAYTLQDLFVLRKVQLCWQHAQLFETSCLMRKGCSTGGSREVHTVAFRRRISNGSSTSKVSTPRNP